MRDPKKKAAPEANREAAQQDQCTEIVDAPNGERKQDFGRCPCGAQIGAVHTIGCKTCGAWIRWRSAFRLAVHAIRGPQ